MLSNNQSITAPMHSCIFSLSSLQRLKQSTASAQHNCILNHTPTTPLATYRQGKVRRKSQSGDVRKGIICYLMVLVGLTISSMMVYGYFFA